MTPEQRGHVKVSRKFFAEDPFWTEAREFSRAEAWLDVVQRAAWRPYRQVVKGAVVELERGEFLASLRFLVDAWGWGIKKVRLFLASLQEMDRIRAQRETHWGTVYLVVNYEHYQTGGAREEPEEGTVGAQSGHSQGTKRSSKAGEAVQTGIHPLRATEAVDPEHLITLAIRAANAGMADNHRIDQRRFNPILPQHGESRQLAREWFDAGIPWETVLEAVYYTAAEEYKPTDRYPQVLSLKYFRNPVQDLHERKLSSAMTRPERAGQPVHPDAEVNRITAEEPGLGRKYQPRVEQTPEALARIMADLEKRGLTRFASALKPAAGGATR